MKDKNEIQPPFCLFCEQPRETHDQMVCDAIRAVLQQRIKRANEKRTAA